jgi:hypothetical protein
MKSNFKHATTLICGGGKYVSKAEQMLVFCFDALTAC